MAKIQFLTILLTVSCFLGGVVSVTDKDFKVCSEHLRVVMLKICTYEMRPFCAMFSFKVKSL